MLTRSPSILGGCFLELTAGDVEVIGFDYLLNNIRVDSATMNSVIHMLYANFHVGSMEIQ